MKTKYMKKFATIKDYIKTKNDRDFPGGPVVKTPHFHCRGPGVQSPVGKLRSHMSRGVAKKKPTKVNKV